MPRLPFPTAAAAAAAAGALAALLAACAAPEDAATAPPDQPALSEAGTPRPAGSDAPTATTPPAPTPAPPTPPAAADQQSGPTALTVTVDDGAGATSTRTLTCDPVGGDVPDPAAVCAGIAAVGPAAFAPARTDLACAMEFGGPQTATVTGTVRGRPVTADYSRTNGCETARWDALAPLLGAVGGGPDS